MTILIKELSSADGSIDEVAIPTADGGARVSRVTFNMFNGRYI